MISRRGVNAGLLTALSAGLVAQARAQTIKPPRVIAILYSHGKDDLEGRRFHSAFRESLGALGWSEGVDLKFEIRWAGGDTASVLAHAKELVGLKPDLILTHSTQLVSAFSKETREIPVVFAGASDPVESGLVTSLARPGGNITGFSTLQFASNGKLLALLKEVAQNTSRVAVLRNPSNPSHAGRFEGVAAFAQSLNVEVIAIDLNSVADIDDAIDRFAATPGGGLIVLPGGFASANRLKIIAAAARGKLPAIYPRDFYVRDGGLMSYNTSQIDQFRAAAFYVDRILKGENAGELPVQTATKFHLALNMKTAKDLGLDPPTTLLALADELVE
jgi:putative ABC transport system substrate-binding protein